MEIKPTFVDRLGNVSLSEFSNERSKLTGNDPVKFISKNVVVQKVYTGKDGKPANTNSFNRSELRNLHSLIENYLEFHGGR
ncbi:hypothetical protein CMI37_25050 [Candidatus Pacearchaeota archaeon]|nr:hypothetical protein [Candidatus Pacearchaeota archaeon]|tara:strand:+ start:7131 stop:7373 length:243 start_codon:yes stop_codon:yes gene_type:complete